MKKLFINLFALVITISTFWVLSPNVSAAVGEVKGQVVVKPTGAGVPNIWVKWTSPIDFNNSGGRYIEELTEYAWPYEGNIGARYTKTDGSGNFMFNHHAAPMYNSSRPGWDNAHSLLNVNARIKDFLTWIKPEQPEIPPDDIAYQQYLEEIGQAGYVEDGKGVYDQYDQKVIVNAIKKAQRYRPQGEGWARIVNRTSINGGFQCDAPPTITAIKPASFKGFFNNNDQKAYDWGNGYTPIILQAPFEFNVTGPAGYHDGEGVFAGSGNENSCSVYGWTKDLTSNLKYDVEIFIGGPAGSGAPSIKTKADKVRGDSLNGFGFDIRLPQQYQDGVRKDIYAYALDTDGTRVPLAQSPRSLVCGTPQPGAIPRPKVDIWAESGRQITGRGTPGGTLTINPNQATTIAWTARNSSLCVGSGNWAGVKRAGTTRLSQQLAKTDSGATYNYTLTCFNNETGEQESDTVIIRVSSTDKPFIQTTEGDVHSNEDISVPNTP